MTVFQPNSSPSRTSTDVCMENTSHCSSGLVEAAPSLLISARTRLLHFLRHTAWNARHEITTATSNKKDSMRREARVESFFFCGVERSAKEARVCAFARPKLILAHNGCAHKHSAP